VGNNVERSVHVESRDPSSAETRRCPLNASVRVLVLNYLH